MLTSSASSSFDKCAERLPLVSPVRRCRKRKSALRHAESAVRIDSRAGSCTSRSRSAISSNGAGIAILHHRPHDPGQFEVIEQAANDVYRADHGEEEIDRVLAVRNARERQRTRRRNDLSDEEVVQARAAGGGE